jgi:pilus assembly protein FimV
VAFNKEKVMDAARKFVDKGQIDKAVKEYLRIVQEDPKDVRVWLKIGDLYAKKGAKQDATETYLKVARFYHEQGFFLKAVAVYKQILKLDPRLVDVILKLAELYRQLGLMSDAMQHYESVAAHFHREGNTKEALDTVKKLVDLDPENIATRIKLAELYSKEGLVEEAVLQFSMACEQLRRQGRQDDFIKVAERLLWHKPDNHSLNRELAGLYLRRNDPRRALQKLQQCFKADPRDAETLGLLALAFQALDQKAKTVSVLKELARIHVENKHRDKAGEVYRKIIEIVPNDPDALQFLGPQAAAAPPPQHHTPTPPPTPPARNTPPPPPLRTGTPLPAAVRQATNAAKFNITTDLPALDLPISSKMTGAMPLVDEQSLSGVDFALPEYDDADFSADMEPPPDPRRTSAAGERHAEEISKILAETDVYVKYGLHQKAVDHLRRVFTLDGDNVEAHERLKDIFISQGREQEAEVELLKLAELIAPSDPDRAEAYLHELLAMNGTHTGAFELARRFQLRVARMSSVSAEVEYSGGGVAEVDSELDDLDLSGGPPAAMGIARGGHNGRDSVDELASRDLLGRNMAHGSPAPSRPPRPPQYDDGGFDVELDSQVEALNDYSNQAAHSTRQVPADDMNALAQQSYEDEDSAVLVDRPPAAGWDGHDYPATAYEGAEAYGASLDDAVDSQLDDEALGQDIDQEVAAELGGVRAPEGPETEDGEDLPFDPNDAREFDRGVSGVKHQTDAVYVSGFEQTELPATTASYDDVSDPLSASGNYDPYGTEAVQPNYEATVMGGPLVDEIDTPPVGGSRAESLVEDDLEEVNFYSDQGMYAEAIDSLRGLFDRYPNHPLLTAKMRELEALEQGIEPVLHTPPSGQSADVAASHENTGTDALDLDEIEEVSADDMLEEVDPGDSAAVRSGGGGKRKPSVMLEKPVDESDADTHYDLGLAYKEMGLYDEAIKAFEKVLRAPGREVSCRVMIGMCHRETNNPTDAIHQFKQGLHANASERERLSLYYEIGITYEAMGDLGEALYYYEAVLKRDGNFADTSQRADAIRQRGTRPSQPADDDL